jgi:hypothetical protein
MWVNVVDIVWENMVDMVWGKCDEHNIREKWRKQMWRTSTKKLLWKSYREMWRIYGGHVEEILYSSAGKYGGYGTGKSSMYSVGKHGGYCMEKCSRYHIGNLMIIFCGKWQALYGTSSIPGKVADTTLENLADRKMW